MALIPATLTTLMVGSFNSLGMIGTAVPSTANAISTGLVPYILASAVVNTVDTGTAGAGVGTGTVTGIFPAGLSAALVGSFSSNGMLGTATPQFTQALGNSIVPFLLTAQVSTINTGVATGTGSGKVTGFEPNSMAGFLIASFAANGLTGTSLPQLANAIAQGVCLYLNASLFASVVIVGAPVVPPVPGVGTGFGKLI